jgi:hypothetical protein
VKVHAEKQEELHSMHAHTVIYPRTVMVHPYVTLVAGRAVMGHWWFHCSAVFASAKEHIREILLLS